MPTGASDITTGIGATYVPPAATEPLAAAPTLGRYVNAEAARKSSISLAVDSVAV